MDKVVLGYTAHQRLFGPKRGKRNFIMDKVASYDLPNEEEAGRNVRLLACEKRAK
jgi:hypothetical protein